MVYTAQFLDTEIYPESTILKIDINPFPHGAKQRQSVLICKHDEPIIILCIYVEIDDNGYLLEQCFRDLLLNENKIALLYGQHVHLFCVSACPDTAACSSLSSQILCGAIRRSNWIWISPTV